MEGIQLSVEKTGTRNSISVIKVGGYIDTTTSSELEHALSTLLKSGSHNIIIDLGNVDYVSSAGWGIFISEIKGIREKGGDLKLVRMIPEVYEVFELLEFHYILKAFESIEEAVRDFERTLPSKVQGPELVEVETGNLGQKAVHATEAAQAVKSEKPHKMERGDSLEEKVRKVITANPDASMIQIARILHTPQYGNTKIGWFGLRRILKKLGLDSKEKRAKLAKLHS